MILIDTSAWIEFLRDTGSPTCEPVDVLLEGEISVCETIRMEVVNPAVAGPRTRRNRARRWSSPGARAAPPGMRASGPRSQGLASGLLFLRTLAPIVVPDLLIASVSGGGEGGGKRLARFLALPKSPSLSVREVEDEGVIQIACPEPLKSGRRNTQIPIAVGSHSPLETL